MEINVTFYEIGLIQNETYIDYKDKRLYKVNLNLDSGV